MARIQQSVLFVGIAVLAACGGCARWKTAIADETDKNILAPLGQASHSATLEVYFVTFPPGAEASLAAIWKETDEQKHASDLQRRLAARGFRVGSAANPAPAALEGLLRSKTSGADGTIARLDADPTVSRKLMSLRFDSAGQILSSDVEERVPLFEWQDGKLIGRDYLQAQGLFSIVATAADAGRLSLELTPELHHGEASQQWTGRDGRFVMEASRPKQVFADLAMRTDLAVGDVLLVGCRADRPGSLGHFFFAREVGSQPQQRLLVVRVKSLGE